MIYTITCNPSLDYAVTVENFQTAHTNRTTSEQILVGGKGINVSLVLRNLGVDTVILGFAAGFTGVEIERRLVAERVPTDFVHLEKGDSRINVKLISIEGTEINGQGPHIPKARIRELEQKLEKIRSGDILVLAGNVPRSMGSTVYAEMMEHLSGKNIQIVVDAAGSLLKTALVKQPFLIKPNRDELEELFQETMNTKEEILDYAAKLQRMGARNVLVSLGNEGALLLTENKEAYGLGAPKGKVCNAVGAGDSMVAGFLAGYLKTGDYEKAFRMSVAAGSASAFSYGLTTKEETEEVLNRLGRTKIF